MEDMKNIEEIGKLIRESERYRVLKAIINDHRYDKEFADMVAITKMDERDEDDD